MRAINRLSTLAELKGVNLEQTFSELELFFANYKEISTPEPSSQLLLDDKQTVLTRLQQLLTEADGEVLDFFYEQELMIRDLFTDNDFQLLYDAVNSFEFEKAQSIIQHYQYGE